MKAVMIKDDYIDLVPGYEYEIERIFSNYAYIILKDSPRRYDIHSFKITHNGRELSHREAYRQYKYESAMKKIGIRKGVGK